MTWQDVVIDLFTLGIVNFGKLRSVANTLQERRFTSVGPADHEDPEVTYAIEVLFDSRRVQLDLCKRIVCDHVIGIRGGIGLDLSRGIFGDHVTSITGGGIKLDLSRRTCCGVLGLVHGQAYSKRSYYSLVLDGEAANLSIDSGAMILAVIGQCRIVLRKCYFADDSQNTRRNHHTDDTG